MWIDNIHNLKRGDFAFFIEVTMLCNGHVRMEAKPHPEYSVTGGNPVLHGPVGEINNRRKLACGMVEVIDVNTYGDRIEVRQLKSREAKAQASMMGYEGIK
jgi:hypothetical protein